MPFLSFSQSSFNFAFAYASVVFPSGHAERYVKRQLMNMEIMNLSSDSALCTVLPLLTFI
jgi:hypothetical protein